MSSFQIIPVIDIMDGLAVHARRGMRDQYRPVQSVLCKDSVPENLVQGMLKLHPFPFVYVADLNAIQGKGAQDQVVSVLAKHTPLWLDRGISTADDAQQCGNTTLVIGTENLPDLASWLRIKESVADDRLVLSLDFDPAGGLRGPPDLWSDPDLWPSRVIVMTLDRVGSGGGPDLGRLEQAQGRSAKARIFAAGGVRNMDDLAALKRAGLSGALVATALHDGTIKNSPADGGGVL